MPAPVQDRLVGLGGVPASLSRFLVRHRHFHQPSSRVKGLPERDGKPRRAAVPDRRDQHRGGDELSVSAKDPLAKRNRRSAQCRNPGLHIQEIVDQRRREKVDLQGAHSEDDSGACRKIPVGESAPAQPLCPPALKKPQIGSVIDAAGKVSVFVVDSNRERAGRGMRHSTDTTMVQRPAGFAPVV